MAFLELIPVPPRGTFNLGLTAAGNAHMLTHFGHSVAGGAYRPDGQCSPVTNQAFRAQLVTRSVGPFKVTGLRPAVDSLREVLDRVEKEMPALHAIIGTAGMLCPRFTKIRQPGGGLKIGPGISNHSWGTAVDLTLGGKLDQQGNRLTQRGLLILSAYFNAAGWFWGAGFGTEDAMHFEASKGLLARWRQAGLV